MSALFDLVLHLDKHIDNLIQTHGPQTYVLLFLIIFAETGFVVTPFLPGDSLLFAVGLFCHSDSPGYTLDIYTVIVVLSVAAIIGDQVNYQLGKWLGPRVFRNENARFFKRSHLLKTEEFFATHGGKAVIMARFVPVVRTFAPFVAGMGAMSYRKFCFNSVVGAFLWVTVCSGAGYLFGRIPAVKEHFELGILALVALSVIPMLFEYAKHRRRSRIAIAEKNA